MEQEEERFSSVWPVLAQENYMMECCHTETHSNVNECYLMVVLAHVPYLKWLQSNKSYL